MSCTHNWLLQSPDHAGISAGRCMKCGAVKSFDGGSPFTTRSEHPQRRTQSGWKAIDQYALKNKTRMSDDLEDQEDTS